ncbi:MAG: hypothetical protein Ct9H300mP4_15580 [Gammaproteobacteria bacterium]|nr:MAG: hypothetical protein Ct9H300mP4_15580 [Gammaproteobacteria bacterium]
MPRILNQFPMMNLFQINSGMEQLNCYVRDNNLPVRVYDMNIPNALFKIVKGENIGTLIS